MLFDISFYRNDIQINSSYRSITIDWIILKPEMVQPFCLLYFVYFFCHSFSCLRWNNVNSLTVSHFAHIEIMICLTYYLQGILAGHAKLRGPVRRELRSDSYGASQNSTLRNFVLPGLIVTKLGMVDYVGISYSGPQKHCIGLIGLIGHKY